MNKYILIVTSNAAEGREEEFNHWYDNIHIPEVLQIPGFKNGTRYHNINPEINTPYLAIFEIESNDIDTTIELLNENRKVQSSSDSIDVHSASFQIFKGLNCC